MLSGNSGKATCAGEGLERELHQGGTVTGECSRGAGGEETGPGMCPRGKA